MIPSVSTATFTRTPTTRSRFPVQVLSALLFLILAKAPSFCDGHEAEFENSRYALGMIDQYDEAVQELDNIGILGTLTGAKVINEGFYEPGAVSLLFMYSYLWNEPFEPLPDCTNQSFGFEGQWTDTICNTIETLREACNTKESSCDPEAFQTVAAGTGDVIQASADRFASLLCLASTDPQSGPSDDFMIAICTDQDVIDSLQPNIVDLRAAVNAYVPGGFENIVFTKDVDEVATAYFDLDEYGDAQADLSDPDSNLV